MASSMEGCTAAGVIAEAGVLGRASVVGVLLLGCALWPSTSGAAQVAGGATAGGEGTIAGGELRL